MIARGLVLRLGLSQFICWGISFYYIAAFGDSIGTELGWSKAEVFGGFSVALLVMGVASPWIGRLVDRRGGHIAMTAGSILMAGSLAMLAGVHSLVVYYAAWVVLGLAMRLCLYDAAFAALARIGGPAAKTPISQITLFGGVASTAFWPIGHVIESLAGWRGATWAFAGFALATLPLHATIPAVRYAAPSGDCAVRAMPRAVSRGDKMLAGGLFAFVTTFVTVLNAAMSAHMIGILAGLGASAAGSIWIATLRGVGQSLARLAELVFGRTFSPLWLGLLATGLLPLVFLAGFLSGTSIAAALVFAFFYGAGNGLATIARGTQPLMLFDPRVYGTLVGSLIMPSFILSALAPIAYALIIDRWGAGAALATSTLIGTAVAAASAVLVWRFEKPAEAA